MSIIRAANDCAPCGKNKPKYNYISLHCSVHAFQKGVSETARIELPQTLSHAELYVREIYYNHKQQILLASRATEIYGQVVQIYPKHRYISCEVQKEDASINIYRT